MNDENTSKLVKTVYPTKDEIKRGVEYYKSLSPAEQLVIDKARRESFNLFTIMCGTILLLIPFMLFYLFG